MEIEKMAIVEQYFLRASAKFLKEDFMPKIEEAVALLSEEEVWQRPASESNSVGNLLLHLAGNVRQHVIAGLGGAQDERLRNAEFNETDQPPKEKLLEVLKKTVDDACSVIENLDPEMLTTKRVIQNTEVRVLDDIIHVVEHFSYHTGQIVFWVKTFRRTTFPWYDYLDET